MDLKLDTEFYRPPRKMMSQITTVIHESYRRACVAVYKRHGAEMEESICNEIWEQMLSDMSDTTQEVSIPTISSTASVVDDEKEDSKLTPLQRLEKQVRNTTDKINTIRSRQGAKQTPKQKEKDPEDLKKLSAKLVEIEGKLKKLTEKTEKKHMEKWTPTWVKHYKAAGGKDDEKTAFQEYVNGLTEAEFKKSSYAEHAKAYVSRPVPKVEPEVEEEEEEVEEEEAEEEVEPEAEEEEAEDEDEDVVEVEYDHETFIVGTISKKVYRVTEQGDVPVQDLDLISAVLKKFKKA